MAWKKGFEIHEGKAQWRKMEHLMRGLASGNHLDFPAGRTCDVTVKVPKWIGLVASGGILLGSVNIAGACSPGNCGAKKACCG